METGLIKEAVKTIGIAKDLFCCHPAYDKEVEALETLLTLAQSVLEAGEELPPTPFNFGGEKLIRLNVAQLVVAKKNEEIDRLQADYMAHELVIEKMHQQISDLTKELERASKKNE